MAFASWPRIHWENRIENLHFILKLLMTSIDRIVNCMYVCITQQFSLKTLHSYTCILIHSQLSWDWQKETDRNSDDVSQDAGDDHVIIKWASYWVKIEKKCIGDDGYSESVNMYRLTAKTLSEREFNEKYSNRIQRTGWKSWLVFWSPEHGSGRDL